MIKKILMKKIACYKTSTELETDKKVNLVYGLNGSGKSTLSNFLYDSDNPVYQECLIEGLVDEEILVYNQRFVNDYFYTSESLPGIFTLSRENKSAKDNINKIQTEIESLENDRLKKEDSRTQLQKELQNNKDKIERRVWDIKRKYTGGDRVLEYCLRGSMGSKERLLSHLLSIEKPIMEPDYSIAQLKEELEVVSDENAEKYSNIPYLKLDVQDIERNAIFQLAIIGNETSAIADLISELKNSDWVKKGLDFIPEEIGTEAVQCPFCQQNSINHKFIDSIHQFFDETYELNLEKLNKLHVKYNQVLTRIIPKHEFVRNKFISSRESEFELVYENLMNLLNSNKQKISHKIMAPSQMFYLEESSRVINEFNEFIAKINKEIDDYNKRIDEKDKIMEDIKDKFWLYNRWQYDAYIEEYFDNLSSIDSRKVELEKQLNSIGKSIEFKLSEIKEQQRKTVNIDEAIENINNGLLELGISDFRIIKHDDSLYKLNRDDSCENIFQTLSEGEKMIITFLYFREMCKGQTTIDSARRNKIIVIDDPISSLSNIFVFNIGQLIKHDFFSSAEFEQIFVLTHSLYFFYELTDTKHDRREGTQRLFRITKNDAGSKLNVMKYEEIQNDYQSYWQIIKDNSYPPALIANSMRNIIEYFFGFVEKQDFNNVFQKSTLKENRYQAFYRYINRESHSIGQNIFDFKEFNYESFKEAFKLVFIENGYEAHYKRMMK